MFGEGKAPRGTGIMGGISLIEFDDETLRLRTGARGGKQDECCAPGSSPDSAAANVASA